MPATLDGTARLFAAAGVVRRVGRGVNRLPHGRGVWTESVRTAFADLVAAGVIREGVADRAGVAAQYGVAADHPLAALHATVADKVTAFLGQVKAQLAKLNVGRDGRKQFFTNLVNLIMRELNVGIEGSRLTGPITQLRTSFPRPYESGNRQQAALIRRQYEAAKAAYAMDGEADPHAAAVAELQRNWKGLTPNLLRTLGVTPKVTPKAVPAAPEPEAAVAARTGVVPEAPVAQPPAAGTRLGAKQMTFEQMVADAKEKLAQVSKLVRRKDERVKAMRRYLGQEHFGSGLSRSRVIDRVIDELFGRDRHSGKGDPEKDAALAAEYTAHFKAARQAAGVKRPSLRDLADQADEDIKRAAESGRGYVRVIVTNGDPSAEAKVAFYRDRLRKGGYTVTRTEEDERRGGLFPLGSYSVHFDKNEGEG